MKKKEIEVECKKGAIRCKYHAVRLAVYVLRNKRDIELENLIRSFGYQLNEDKFYKNLDHISKENRKLLRLEQI